MAIAFVSDSAKAYGVSGAATTPVPVPAGISAGQMMVMAFAVGQVGTPSDVTDWDGFTPLGAGPVTITGAGSFTIHLRVAIKEVVGDEGANFTIAHVESQNTVAWVGTYSGVDTADPLGNLDIEENEGTGSTTTALQIVTDVDGTALVLCAVDFGDTTNNLTPPTGMDERHDAVVNYAADVIQAAAGASGNKTFTNNGTPWAAILVPLVPAEEGDVTAPVLSNAAATETGETTASLSVDTDEGNGTLYWVVTTSSSQPSAAQIVAGQDHTGAAASDSGNQAVVGSGTQNVAGGASGLTANTAYWAYFVQDDAALNRSNIVSDTFTTDEEAEPPDPPVPTELPEGAGGGGARRGRRYPYPNVIDDGWDWEDRLNPRPKDEPEPPEKPKEAVPAPARVTAPAKAEAPVRLPVRLLERSGPTPASADQRVTALEAEVEALRAEVERFKAMRRDDEEEQRLLKWLMEDSEA